MLEIIIAAVAVYGVYMIITSVNGKKIGDSATGLIVNVFEGASSVSQAGSYAAKGLEIEARADLNTLKDEVIKKQENRDELNSSNGITDELQDKYLNREITYSEYKAAKAAATEE